KGRLEARIATSFNETTRCQGTLCVRIVCLAEARPCAKDTSFVYVAAFRDPTAFRDSHSLPKHAVRQDPVMNISIAVVPVAGLGTRLLPATKSQPKEMLPVAKKPVVQYVVEELEANGVNQIVFITGKSKTSIENHFDFDHELMRNLREGG